MKQRSQWLFSVLLHLGLAVLAYYVLMQGSSELPQTQPVLELSLVQSGSALLRGAELPQTATESSPSKSDTSESSPLEFSPSEVQPDSNPELSSSTAGLQLEAEPVQNPKSKPESRLNPEPANQPRLESQAKRQNQVQTQKQTQAPTKTQADAAKLTDSKQPNNQDGQADSEALAAQISAAQAAAAQSAASAGPAKAAAQTVVEAEPLPECPPFAIEIQDVTAVSSLAEPLECQLSHERCEVQQISEGVKRFPNYDKLAGVTQGAAVVEFYLNHVGLPIKLEVVSASTPGMAQSAHRYIASSRYAQSGRCNKLRQTVQFNLR